MSKMEYMPVELSAGAEGTVPRWKNTKSVKYIKILYSLFLDRLKFAVQNGWVRW